MGTLLPKEVRKYWFNQITAHKGFTQGIMLMVSPLPIPAITRIHDA